MLAIGTVVRTPSGDKGEVTNTTNKGRSVVKHDGVPVWYMYADWELTVLLNPISALPDRPWYEPITFVSVHRNPAGEPYEDTVLGSYSEYVDDGSGFSKEGWCQLDENYSLAVEDYQGWRYPTRRDIIEHERNEDLEAVQRERARAALGNMTRVRKSLTNPTTRELPTRPGQYLDQAGDIWTVRVDGSVDLMYTALNTHCTGLSPSSASTAFGPYTRIN